jgi:hypothetical protein
MVRFATQERRIDHRLQKNVGKIRNAQASNHGKAQSIGSDHNTGKNWSMESHVADRQQPV